MVGLFNLVDIFQGFIMNVISKKWKRQAEFFFIHLREELSKVCERLDRDDSDFRDLQDLLDQKDREILYLQSCLEDYRNEVAVEKNNARAYKSQMQYLGDCFRAEQEQVDKLDRELRDARRSTGGFDLAFQNMHLAHDAFIELVLDVALRGFKVKAVWLLLKYRAVNGLDGATVLSCKEDIDEMIADLDTIDVEVCSGCGFEHECICDLDG